MRISQWPKVNTKWYLGVQCLKCRTPILFALDHGEGIGQPPRTGRLVLTCPLADCGHQADYSTAAVSRFQKQPPATKEMKHPGGSI
ncbi:MAG: hypothetical protein DMG14_22945 [Acidobacteria bacterium]|nr:MAG: hypothetical protein DMG14_22945 [Acidobacteriota bacterium]